jgi:hypothetical protein
VLEERHLVASGCVEPRWLLHAWQLLGVAGHRNQQSQVAILCGGERGSSSSTCLFARVVQ